MRMPDVEHFSIQCQIDDCSAEYHTISPTFMPHANSIKAPLPCCLYVSPRHGPWVRTYIHEESRGHSTSHFKGFSALVTSHQDHDRTDRPIVNLIRNLLYRTRSRGTEPPLTFVRKQPQAPAFGTACIQHTCSHQRLNYPPVNAKGRIQKFPGKSWWSKTE
jgi:hypothetical protein